MGKAAVACAARRGILSEPEQKEATQSLVSRRIYAASFFRATGMRKGRIAAAF